MKTVLVLLFVSFFVFFTGHSAVAQTNIVILIPGTTGTDLIPPAQAFNDTSNTVWPTQVEAAVADSQFSKALSLLEGTNLLPGIPGGTAIINSSSTGYGNLAWYFDSCGYSYINAHWGGANWGLSPGPLTTNLMIGFGYDWREDNSKTADSLHSLLSTIYNLYGNSTNIFIVAHSMGGLVTRYYLESGLFKSDAWLPQIKALITLGTPHLGAGLAFGAIIGKLDEIVDMDKDIKALIPLAQSLMTSGFNSTYELLPPPQVSCINSWSVFDSKLPNWIIKNINNSLAKSNSNWQSIQPYLQQANNFFSKLNYTNTPSTSVPYYCFYLDDPATTCTKYTTVIDLGFTAVDVGGDYVVPTTSAMFANGSAKATYKIPTDFHDNHMVLPTLPYVKQNVYHLIDSLSTK